MAKTDFKSADEYIATFPPDVQEALRQIRRAFREAVPDAEEVISYQIPAFKYHGWIVYYHAHAKHYSIAFPPPSAVFEEFKDRLVPYNISKSTIQFPKSSPLPLDLMSEIAKFRAQENIEKEQRKGRK